MANFELRFYIIYRENFDKICKNRGISSITDLTHEQIIEEAEELGTVYSLNQFLRIDIFTFDTDYVRAFFIDMDNEENPPIPADGCNTVITANKIVSNHDTLYLEEERNKAPIAKTYQLIISKNEDTSVEDVMHELYFIAEIQNTEFLEETEDKIRLEMKTDIGFSFDEFENVLGDSLGVDVEIENVTWNF